MAQLLADAAPASSRKVIMRAALSDEGDHACFEFDSVNEHGEICWFTGGAGLNAKLLQALVAHRAFWISQNQPPWKRYELSLDLGSGRFSLEIEYA
jgi:hypothetical protein